MLDPGASPDIARLIADASDNAQQFANTVEHFGADSSVVGGVLDLGLPFNSAAITSPLALEEVQKYRARVATSANGCGWMDNTTILTATTLMSDTGRDAMTPLTIWDLVTFFRAIVSYGCIYHHEHPGVDDDKINRALGETVLTSVPLPLDAQKGTSPLSDGWVGPHHFMWDTWEDAYGWLKRLSARAGTQTLDGVQLVAVRNAWRYALDDPHLTTDEIVNWEDASTRWQSPSDELMRQIADATDVADTNVYVDPTPSMRELAKQQAIAGVKQTGRRGELLTDLNLRAYVNQRLADFFELPYVCGVARVPFRRHLYDQAVAVQHQLSTIELVDGSYEQLAANARLRLPVFLAIAIRQASKPDDLWAGLGTLRSDGAAYRRVRINLDEALGRGNLKEAEKLAKALSTSVDNVLKIAGEAVVAGGVAGISGIAQGDVVGVASGVAALQAAGKKLLDSSVVDRLRWRLLKPHLLWINNIMDEARTITEALPDLERIWKVPEREREAFVERFKAMGALQTSVTTVPRAR
jgi:hypothetical protein